jgi:hypothetical protein
MLFGVSTATAAMSSPVQMVALAVLTARRATAEHPTADRLMPAAAAAAAAAADA